MKDLNKIKIPFIYIRPQASATTQSQNNVLEETKLENQSNFETSKVNFETHTSLSNVPSLSRIKKISEVEQKLHSELEIKDIQNNVLSFEESPLLKIDQDEEVDSNLDLDLDSDSSPLDFFGQVQKEEDSEYKKLIKASLLEDEDEIQTQEDLEYKKLIKASLLEDEIQTQEDLDYQKAIKASLEDFLQPKVKESLVDEDIEAVLEESRLMEEFRQKKQDRLIKGGVFQTQEDLDYQKAIKASLEDFPPRGRTSKISFHQKRVYSDSDDSDRDDSDRDDSDIDDSGFFHEGFGVKNKKGMGSGSLITENSGVSSTSDIFSTTTVVTRPDLEFEPELTTTTTTPIFSTTTVVTRPDLEFEPELTTTTTTTTTTPIFSTTTVVTRPDLEFEPELITTTTTPIFSTTTVVTRPDLEFEPELVMNFPESSSHRRDSASNLNDHVFLRSKSNLNIEEGVVDNTGLTTNFDGAIMTAPVITIPEVTQENSAIRDRESRLLLLDAWCDEVYRVLPVENSTTVMGSEFSDFTMTTTITSTPAPIITIPEASQENVDRELISDGNDLVEFIDEEEFFLLEGENWLEDLEEMVTMLENEEIQRASAIPPNFGLRNYVSNKFITQFSEGIVDKLQNPEKLIQSQKAFDSFQAEFLFELSCLFSSCKEEIPNDLSDDQYLKIKKTFPLTADGDFKSLLGFQHALDHIYERLAICKMKFHIDGPIDDALRESLIKGLGFHLPQRIQFFDPKDSVLIGLQKFLFKVLEYHYASPCKWKIIPFTSDEEAYNMRVFYRGAASDNLFLEGRRFIPFDMLKGMWIDLLKQKYHFSNEVIAKHLEILALKGEGQDEAAKFFKIFKEPNAMDPGEYFLLPLDKEIIPFDYVNAFLKGLQHYQQIQGFELYYFYDPQVLLQHKSIFTREGMIARTNTLPELVYLEGGPTPSFIKNSLIECCLNSVLREKLHIEALSTSEIEKITIQILSDLREFPHLIDEGRVLRIIDESLLLPAATNMNSAITRHLESKGINIPRNEIDSFIEDLLCLFHQQAVMKHFTHTIERHHKPRGAEIRDLLDRIADRMANDFVSRTIRPSNHPLFPRMCRLQLELDRLRGGVQFHELSNQFYKHEADRFMYKYATYGDIKIFPPNDFATTYDFFYFIENLYRCRNTYYLLKEPNDIAEYLYNRSAFKKEIEYFSDLIQSSGKPTISENDVMFIFKNEKFKRFLMPKTGPGHDVSLDKDLLFAIAEETHKRLMKYEKLWDFTPSRRSFGVFLKDKVQTPAPVPAPAPAPASKSVLASARLQDCGFRSNNSDMDQININLFSIQEKHNENIQNICLEFFLRINDHSSIGFQNYLKFLELSFGLREDQLLEMILNFKTFDEVVISFLTIFIFLSFFFCLYIFINKIKNFVYKKKCSKRKE